MAQTIRVRPSPGLSFFGGLAGIAFLLIGVFVVIPIFGPFGIFWTVIAGVICVAHFYNAFSRRGLATEVIEVSDDSASRGGTPEIRLRTLDGLKSQGLVSDAEYDERRRDILNQI